MTATRIRTTSIAAAMLVAMLPATAVAQDDAIERAVDAIGGADALTSLTGFSVVSNGARAKLDEGETPGVTPDPVDEFEIVATIDADDDRLRVDSTLAPTEFGGVREISEVVVGDVGYVNGANSLLAQPGLSALTSDRVASIRIQQELLNPQLLLRDVLADPSIATTGADSIEIAHGPTPITLTLDAESGLITQASTLENNPLRRDVELVVSYADWSGDADGVAFPTSVSITYDGDLVYEATQEIFAEDPDASLFEVPAELDLEFDPVLAERGDLEHQYLQQFEAAGFPLDGYTAPVTATEIAPGIYQLTSRSYNTVVVLQDEGVVIFEAPLNETRTGQVLEFVETVAEGRPITHIVQSHHHVDHSGGLRSMAVATGATPVVAESALPLWESVMAAPSTVSPDGIDGSSVSFTTVGSDPFVIESGTNTVTAYPFPNAHAEDFMLVEAGGVLWVVDIYNAGFGLPLPSFLVDFVTSAGIDVTTIAGGHGSTDVWADKVDS